MPLETLYDIGRLLLAEMLILSQLAQGHRLRQLDLRNFQKFAPLQKRDRSTQIQAETVVPPETQLIYSSKLFTDWQ